MGAAPVVPDPNESRIPEIIGATVTLLTLSTLAVFLRFLSRWVARAGYWWDDFMIVVALETRYAGFGKHLRQMPPLPVDPVVFTWFKYLYVFILIFNFAQVANKLSMALFLYRIYPVVQLRRFLKYAAAFVVIFGIACTFSIIFACSPISAFWTTIIGNYDPTGIGGHCIDTYSFLMVASAVNTVLNFIFLILPIPLVWRLQTDKSHKLVLTSIFTVGLAVCGLSITRLIVLKRQGSTDTTWTQVGLALWTAAESSITVVIACLPSLRPFFARMFWASRHKAKVSTQLSQMSLASSWKRGKDKDSFDGGFDKLSETQGGTWAWSNTNNVAVEGGAGTEREAYEIGGAGSSPAAPLKGIMVKTELVQTIHDRLEYHDELF